MPPASSTPASPLHNNSILWPTHSPIKASAMSTSKSTYSLHDEPESISPDDVSTSQQTRSSSQHQHSAGSSGSSTGSGWRAIARKASGRFRRSFSSSGSLVNVAQEAQYHPMPAMPAMPAAYSSKSDLVGDSDPPSPPVSSTSSSGFIGNILSRKKSRDSLNTSSGSEGSSGRRPRPPWNDLPPSPQLPQQQSHKLYSSQSSNGSTLSFKLGRSGKQRLDHVQVRQCLTLLTGFGSMLIVVCLTFGQVTPFEVKPSLSLERSSTDNGLLSPGPARIAPRRASTDVSVASKTPKPSGVPRSASAQYFVQQRPASIGSTMPGMARSNSSSGNSPPPVFLDEDMPPVPPLPQDVKKDPITFSHSTSSTVSSSNPSSRSISESSNHLSQSCQSPRISSRPPPIVQPPKVSLDCSEETSEPLTPHAIDQPAASTATLPERIRFPAAFGFVPRPDTADGPDSVFGADASAACIPTPYGHLRAANSDISLSSAISSEADRSGQSSAASSATSLQPPKRTNSLSPLSRSEAPPLPRRNKALEFEELLASDIGTMKISLGQSKR